MSVMYREYFNLMFVDDKAGVNIGEPEFSISTLPRNKKGIVAFGVENFAGDHDFHRFKVTLSVLSVVTIPEHQNNSFYFGQVYIAIKGTVFQPSSSIRYVAEQYAIMVQEAVQANPIQAVLADGGPEHKVRNGSVKLAHICLFLKTGADLSIMLNTAPNNSWANPVERTHSTLNIAWSNLSLCRSAMNEEDEQTIKSCSSMQMLRDKVEGDEILKKNVMNSVKPCSNILLQRAIQMEHGDRLIKEGPCSCIRR